jgi:KH domain
LHSSLISCPQSNVKSHGAEGGVTSAIPVPLKYHHSISQQGSFFKTLRSFGVHVDQSAQPSRSAIPVRLEPSARIDDTTSAEASGVEWELVLNYQDSEEGDSIWTLKGRDQASLDKAENLIKEAIENAVRMSHIGFLTLADRSMFPRIVGTKGANVARLRNETGADITVSRENNTIVIIGVAHSFIVRVLPLKFVILGAENEVITAKDAILRMMSNSGRSRRHD